MKHLQAHQLVHGYKRGHRLLAGSASLSPEALRLVDRLSDAAGTSVARDSSGYLTGYPLPHGDYALAKTWSAPDAERPNVVWTHTLVLPQVALSALSLQSLGQLFRRPRGHDDLAGYTEPLPIGHLADRAPTPVHDPEASAIVAALYWGEAGALLAGPEGADDLCLAIWSQQWPRLRRSFSFCSGALEPRRLDGKTFDLLLAPYGHRTGPPAKGPDATDDDAVRALVHDLRSPGDLRDFLRACGADSGQLRSLALLTTTWTAVRGGASPTDVLESVTVQAPKPNGLRRLKRGLLRGPKPLLSAADPVLTLRTLATPGVGDRILAEDADVEAWAGRAWQADRRVIGRLAGHRRDGPVAAPQDPDRPETAAAAVPRSALAVLLERAVPADLVALAADAPPAAALVLARQRDPDWWAAWADLPDGGKALADVAMRDEPTATLATAALLKRPDGAAAWRALGGRSKTAVLGLLSAAASIGEPLPEEWAAALASAWDVVLAQVDEGLPAILLAVAADAVPHAPSPPRLNWPAWQALAAAAPLWVGSPVRAAVVLAAALSGDGPEADAAVAAAFSRLHGAFSQGTGDDAWRVVQPSLPGRADDWDRCRRLERGVAKAVSGKNGPARPGILAQASPGKPREALAAELDRRAAEAAKRAHAKNPFDDWLGFLRR